MLYSETRSENSYTGSVRKVMLLKDDIAVLIILFPRVSFVEKIR